jgi:ABC-type Fe3+ transport system substrate-binding protein
VADPLLVYSTPNRLPLARAVLAAACRAGDSGVRLEALSSGSLFRRLHLESGEPRADLVLGNGPYLAEAAARDGFIEGWSALDVSPFVVVGTPPIGHVEQLGDGALRALALPDPARSEVGVMLLLAMLDRARRQGGAPDPWTVWSRRAAEGTLLLTDGPDTALEALAGGRASHALVPGPAAASGAPGTPLMGLAPVPNAVGLVRGAPHEAQARALLAWLVGGDAAASVAGAGGLSPWAADTNGLATLRAAAPPLDVDWTFGQYRAVRQRWLALGLSPQPTA